MSRGSSASREHARSPWAGAAGAALALWLCACSTAVRSGVREHEADALILLLDQSGIAATKEPGRGASSFDVRIPRADLAGALRVLQSHGRLEPEQPGFAEVLGEPPIVPTPAEERDRRAVALAGELARTIEHLPGALRARVHLTPPEPRAALDTAAAAWRASVVVQRRADQPALEEATLRSLLQGAIGPLPEGNVVILQAVAQAPPRADWARLGPFTVAKRDAPLLRATLVGLLLLSALSALLLIVLVARKRAQGNA